MSERPRAELTVCSPVPAGSQLSDQCGEACGAGGPSVATRVRDAGWLRAARWARWLAWVSLGWMVAEGVIGLWQGLAAGSICSKPSSANTTPKGRAAPSRRETRVDVFEAAAKALRHNAAQDAYAGLAKPDVAYAFASFLDMFSLRWTEQPEALKPEVLLAAAKILGDA